MTKMATHRYHSRSKGGRRAISRKLILLLIFWSSPAMAQLERSQVLTELGELSSATPSVAELSKRGDHFEALLSFDDSSTDAKLSEQLAAARSAWALGMVERAREIWDKAFANREFRGEERHRAMLARAILDLQERDYERARAWAERGAQEMEASNLRSQFWLVVAESLKEQGALSLAETYYKKALNEASGESKHEALFLLGENHLKLGMINEARYNFAEIEITSKFSRPAVRRLIEIDLIQKNYEGVLTWIGEGRENFPSEFKDPWSTYAHVTALVELGRLSEAKKELKVFRVRHSESEPWFILASAAFEARYSGATYMRAQLQNPLRDSKEQE